MVYEIMILAPLKWWLSQQKGVRRLYLLVLGGESKICYFQAAGTATYETPCVPETI